MKTGGGGYLRENRTTAVLTLVLTSLRAITSKPLLHGNRCKQQASLCVLSVCRENRHIHHIFSLLLTFEYHTFEYYNNVS